MMDVHMTLCMDMRLWIGYLSMRWVAIGLCKTNRLLRQIQEEETILLKGLYIFGSISLASLIEYLSFSVYGL